MLLESHINALLHVYNYFLLTDSQNWNLLGQKLQTSAKKMHESNHEEIVGRLKLRDIQLTRHPLKNVSVMKDKERLGTGSN